MLTCGVSIEAAPQHSDIVLSSAHCGPLHDSSTTTSNERDPEGLLEYNAASNTGMAPSTDAVDQIPEAAEKGDRRGSMAAFKSDSMRVRLMGKAKSVASGIIADTGVLMSQRRSSMAPASMWVQSCMDGEAGELI